MSPFTWQSNKATLFYFQKKTVVCVQFLGGLRRSPWGPHAQREEQKELEGRHIPVSLPFTLSSSLSHTTFKVSREQIFFKFKSKEEKMQKNSQNLMTVIQISCFVHT